MVAIPVEDLEEILSGTKSLSGTTIMKLKESAKSVPLHDLEPADKSLGKEFGVLAELTNSMNSNPLTATRGGNTNDGGSMPLRTQQPPAKSDGNFKIFNLNSDNQGNTSVPASSATSKGHSKSHATSNTSWQGAPKTSSNRTSLKSSERSGTNSGNLVDGAQRAKVGGQGHGRRYPVGLIPAATVDVVTRNNIHRLTSLQNLDICFVRMTEVRGEGRGGADDAGDGDREAAQLDTKDVAPDRADGTKRDDQQDQQGLKVRPKLQGQQNKHSK